VVKATFLLLRWFDRVTDRPAIAAWASVLATISALVVASVLLDREPPHRFLSFEPVAGHAGDTVIVRQRVERDLGRGCTSHSHRSAIDSRGLSIPVGQRNLSAEERTAIEAKFPGQALIQFQIPATFAPGPAVLALDIEWVCNVTQRLPWPGPIHQYRAVPFEVLQ